MIERLLLNSESEEIMGMVSSRPEPVRGAARPAESDLALWKTVIELILRIHSTLSV